ncbi:unnamed protein product [Paramecium sonneborni]|uniref:Transmembrane protein n=1 Tax=Paramecium sonneborni TaxID=65129 RepID=A0A8S1RB26_9CILI|nr:unnamed protein product [Paramecium sonneborni]
MKSSLVTENGRRTKTNPDQNSIISYSSAKSYLSSERKTQVKATCKVLWEMREDQSSKLAVKFTQLQIVLATQSIIQVISKFKSSKLQTYFWILLQDCKPIQQTSYNHSIQSISLPQVVEDFSYLTIQPKYKTKQRHHSLIIFTQIITQVLNQNRQNQQRNLFLIMKQYHQLHQGTLLLFKFIRKHHHQQQCNSFLAIMQYNQNSLKLNSLDCSNQDINYNINSMQLLQKQQEGNNIEVISINEQLAIKFASTTMMTSLLNDIHRKINFYFFLKILRYQQNNFQLIKDLNITQEIEVSQVIYDQSSLQENQQIIAAQNLHSFLFIKLQNYFQAIKIFHLKNDFLIGETMNTMIIKGNDDLSNSFEDLNGQKILDTNQKIRQDEDDEMIKNERENQKISSLQNITDTEEYTKSTKEVIEEILPQQKSIGKRKIKDGNNKIKNAIKQYCKLQQQRVQSQESIIKQENVDLISNQEMKKQWNHNKLYTPYIMIFVMTILLAMFLK